MDGYVVYGGMQIASGGFMRVADGRGMLLYVWDGELWITQEGDRRDHYVEAGGWFRLDRDGATLAYAMRHSNITLTAPVPSHYARRITVGPRVVYDRALEPGGRLRRLRHRLARGWANAYAPFSRPTTAAL
jgi:hypothetical protein